jgi:hypothetical protein
MNSASNEDSSKNCRANKKAADNAPPRNSADDKKNLSNSIEANMNRFHINMPFKPLPES